MQQQAWRRLGFDDRFFRYANLEKLTLSSHRLRDDKFQEYEVDYQGEIQGVLPAEKTFECKLSDQTSLIRGKIDAAIDDRVILNREWMDKMVTIKLSVMRVGDGRPRLALMSLNDLSLVSISLI